MDKKYLPDLISELDQELLRLGYTKGSMTFYRRRWNQLMAYAEDRGEYYYTEQLGIDFVQEFFGIPSYIREDVLKKNNIEFQEVERLEDALPDLDILYMTRVQKERFFNEEDYVRMKDFYILDKQKMELAKKDMYILHPLPRVNEISTEVDADPRAAYFKQAQYGVYVRMALILTLLEVHVC